MIFFWNCLCLISAVCGRDVAFPDEITVYSNIFTCIVGKTGGGKSRSESFLNKIVDNSVPFKYGDKDQRGVRIIEAPGGEVNLCKSFQHRFTPTNFSVGNGQPNARALPLIVDNVRGIVRYPEFKTIAAKSSMSGSNLEPVLQQLYDTGNRPIGSQSSTNGDYTARDYFGIVNTTTQFKSIRNLMSKDQIASGFINRWIFVIGTPKKKISRGRVPDVSHLYNDVYKLSLWAKAIKDKQGGFIDLPSYNYPLFDDYVVDKAGACEDRSDMLGRSRLILKKLTLLLAINNQETVISDQTILDGQKLFEYTVRCAEFIEGNISYSPEAELEREIYETIKSMQDISASGHEIGPNISKVARKFRKRDDVNGEKLERVIRMYERSGLLKQVKDTRPGPGRKLGTMYIIPRELR